MGARFLIGFLAVFSLGIATGWAFRKAHQPTKEAVHQREFNEEFRSQLCQRVYEEILKYEGMPQGFFRSSLDQLGAEAMESARLSMEPPSRSDVWSYDDDQRGILSDCEDEGKKWVKIRSPFPEKYASEARIAGVVSVVDVPRSPSNESDRADPDKKSAGIALVIGNAAYLSRPLKTPINDANDVAEFLRLRNFEVLDLRDADLHTMEKTERRFIEKLPQFSTALVYFAGHGIEFRGRNYFLPVNANITKEDEIPRMAIDVSRLVTMMGNSEERVNILVLDACRNAPIFASNRSSSDGLAGESAVAGTLVAFSTAPGQTALDGNGRNSPYTGSLLKELNVSGRNIEDVLRATRARVSTLTEGKQVPWYSSSLNKAYQLN